MKRRSFFNLVASVPFMVTFAGAVAASPVLLTITGNFEGSPVQLTDEDLMALPQTEIKTETIWTVGEQVFSGPTLKSLFESIGAPLEKVKLTAVNKYSVEMPAAAIEDTVPVLAVRRDGVPYGVRNKGPLWLVWPYDDDSVYRSEAIYSYSIWQLTDIEVISE